MSKPGRNQGLVSQKTECGVEEKFMNIQSSQADFNPADQEQRSSGEIYDSPRQENLPSSFMNVLPGLTIVLLIGVAAYYISQLHPSLDALAMAIILGITFRMMLGNAAIFLPGASFAVKIMVPVGIIFYGIGLNFGYFTRLPGKTILLILSCMVLFYGVIYFMNRLFKIPGKLGYLIASGSAICGASAIAVLSPAMEAEPEDTSVSLLVVTAAGLIGAITYPLLKEILHLPDLVYAVLSGATLQQTGIVRVSLTGMTAEVLSYAMAVKTIRILMLLGVAFATGLVQHRAHRDVPIISTLSRVWFLIPFSLIALLVTISPVIGTFLAEFKPIGTFAFSMALGSIGFMVNVESVLTVGSKPLLIGLVGWLIVVAIFLLAWPLFL